VVVELGHDQLVARLPATPQGAAEVEGQRGHVLAEDHLLRRAAQQVGQGLAGLGQGCVGLDAGGVGPVRVGVVAQQVVAHRVHHGGGHLGPPRSVEVGHRQAVLAALEGGEMTADLVDVRDGAGRHANLRRAA